MELTIKHYVLLLATILALIGVNQWLSNPLLISVSGVGEVSVPATKAIVSLTLSERDSTPDGALARIQERAIQFRDYMKQRGFDEVVTTQPQMVPAGLISPSLTGYQVTVSMGGSTTQLNNLQ
jgi:uncharacterized protein YggE